MKFNFFRNPLVRFLVLFIILYTSWYVLYEWVLNPDGKLDRLVINSLVYSSEHLLKLLGFNTFTTHSETIRTVGIDGTHGLWIGDPCDGITLFALSASFILSFPGPAKHKAWFIPASIVGIFLTNIFRITALCIIVLKKPQWLGINHDYIFKILVYGFIFWTWMIWVNRFSGISSLFNKEK